MGPDVLVVNLTSIDRVCHFYWQELEPGSPFPLQETAIFSAFREVDRIIGQLLEVVDDSTSIISFSEIGFGPLRAYCSLNRALAEAGLLSWESGQEERQVNYGASRAFEAVQGTHGVNLNLKGRHREGQVEAADQERVCREVLEVLGNAINPHTGLKLLRSARRREEVYSGQAVEAAPDIIVEPLDERYQPLGDNFWAGRVNRRLQSGWHRRDSYLAAVGAPFAAGRRKADSSPVDVAPTLYRALGLEVPADFSGRAVG
jgi:predicted AlkP superfamily phosphohydrolase/phosphomutase